MMRLVKGKQGKEAQTTYSNAFAHFAGMIDSISHSYISCAVINNALSYWIIDTGASDHMNFHSSLLFETPPLSNPVFVTLRDGALKPVTTVGDITLTPTLILCNVFYVLDFKYNLLSAAKFLTYNECYTTFYLAYYVFQDLLNKFIKPSINQMAQWRELKLDWSLEVFSANQG